MQLLLLIMRQSLASAVCRFIGVEYMRRAHDCLHTFLMFQAGRYLDASDATSRLLDLDARDPLRQAPVLLECLLRNAITASHGTSISGSSGESMYRILLIIGHMHVNAHHLLSEV